MKKNVILLGIFLLLMIFPSVYALCDNSTAESTVLLYSWDGKSQFFSSSEVDEQLTVGWYLEPVTVLYSLDGKTEVCPLSKVDEQLTVGWYIEPVTILYSLDGKTEICPLSKVDEQLTVGWYKNIEDTYKDKYKLFNWKSSDINERAKYVYYFLKAQGFSNKGIAAILGNITQESKICSYTGNSCGYGLVQWTGGRKKNLFVMSNSSSPTTAQQLTFLISELKKDYPSLYNALLSGNSSVSDLTIKFEKQVERAGKPAMQNRINYANQWYNNMQNW